MAIANERAIASAVAQQAAGTTLNGIRCDRAQDSAIARAIARVAADARDAPSDSPPESPLTTPPSSRASSPEPGAPSRASSPNPEPGANAVPLKGAAATKPLAPIARPITASPFTTPPTLATSQPLALAPSPALPPQTTSAEKAWRKEKERKAKLRKKLRLGAALNGQNAPPIKPALVRRWVHGLLDASIARAGAFSSEGMAHTRSAYQGLRDDRATRKACRLEEMEALGLEIRRWDASAPAPILDSRSRVVAIRAAQPRNWESVNRDASATIKTMRKRAYFPKKSTRHRRGDFPALAYGVSYGGGQQVCGHTPPPAASHSPHSGTGQLAALSAE